MFLHRTISSIVRSTVEMMRKMNGHLHLGKYTSQTGINRRQLERRFVTAIALSRKQLGRRIRLQSGLKMILNSNYYNFTTLAYENEFYDQSHFIKDFKEFTGLSPKAFCVDNFKFSTLFYGRE